MRFSILLILISCIYAPLLAQTLPANPLDEKYTPPAKSHFDLAGGKSSRSGRSVGPDHKNFIGFNPVLLVRKIASFSYGRKIGDRFMIRGSIGSSFQPDDILLGTSSMFWELQTVADDSPEHYSEDYEWFIYYLKNSKGVTKSSLFYEVAFRTFFQEEDIQNSGYIEVAYRSYGNSVLFNSGDPDIPSYQLNLQSRGVQLQFGRTISSGTHFVHDFYFGFGLRVFQMDRLTPQYEEDQNGYSRIKEFTTGGDKLSVPSVCALLGYAFHFGL